MIYPSVAYHKKYSTLTLDDDDDPVWTGEATTTIMAGAAKRQEWKGVRGQAAHFTAGADNEGELGVFLDMVGLSNHLGLLVENEMDLTTLRLCTVDDLIQLGLSPLDAAQITRNIVRGADDTRMRQGSTPASTASTDADEDEDAENEAEGSDAPVVFRCVKRAALRKGLSLFSERAEIWLEPGNLVEVLDSEELTMNETQITRVRCRAGWASVCSVAGAQLLEPAEDGAKPNRFVREDNDLESELLEEKGSGCCMALGKICLVILAVLLVLGQSGLIDIQQMLTDGIMWVWYKYGGAGSSTNAAKLNSGAPPPQLTPEHIDPLFSTKVFYPGIGVFRIIGNATNSSEFI